MKYLAIINNQQFEIEIDNDGNLKVNGEPRQVDFLPLGPSLYSIITDHKSMDLVIESDRGSYSVLVEGRLYEGQVLDERAMLMAQRRGGLMLASGELHAPMPGLIVAVRVEVGQTVKAGETVIVLESMKMQNELKAPVDGVVKAVAVEAGQTVDKDAYLLEVELESS
jgi:biotin carboxyl carrier protein